jgi:hypothetical protein
MSLLGDQGATANVNHQRAKREVWFDARAV